LSSNNSQRRYVGPLDSAERVAVNIGRTGVRASTPGSLAKLLKHAAAFALDESPAS
jgi:hypothetical protein